MGLVCIDTATEKVDVLLRDEKEFIGILRSYDQFGMSLMAPSGSSILTVQ
jgi:small nuclear ribonucleoprotein (snRNP)-like protein